MSEGMLRQIKVAPLSALLKGAALARDLAKTGFRPDLLPSPAGRDLARLILRVRDAQGDVTEGVEAQGGEMSSLGAEGERLLALARGTPCPDRERVLAYLADLELLETSQRLRATAAKVEELVGPSPAPAQSGGGGGPPRSPSPRQLHRVRLPDPGAPLPGETSSPRNPPPD